MDQEIRPNEAVEESSEKIKQRGHYKLWIRVIAVILVIAMVLGMLTSVDFSLLRYQNTEQMIAAQYLADNTSYIGENRFQRLKSLLTSLDAYSINQQAAEIAIGKMDYERAATFLNRCIPLSANAAETAELYIRLGCVYMLSENSVEAGQAFDKSIEINSEQPTPYLLRAQLRYQGGDTVGSVEDALVYLELGGNDIDMLSTAASICELGGDLESAVEAMGRMIKGTSDPFDKALAYAERGRIKYLMGKDAAAAADVAEAKKLNEIALTGVHYAILGLWEYDAEDYANAGHDFIMAARLSDEGNSGYYEQAILCGYLSENAAFAAETIREAKEKGMMSANSYLIEGILLFSEERYEEGDEALSASIATGTVVVGAYYYRGLCRLAAGKYEDAALDFTEAINWEESDLACIFNRGVCYYALEDYENAYYDLTYVALNDSEGSLAASALELLDTLEVVEVP